MHGVIAFAVGVAVAASGCGGPCKKIAADRAALVGRTDATPGPSARIRIPLALANRLIAQVVADEEPIALAGPLGRLLGVDEVKVTLREAALVPAETGKIGVDLAIAIDDAEGHLATLRGRTNVDAIVEPGEPPAVAIAVRFDQLAKLDLELSDRARAAAGGAVADAVPDAVKQRVPRGILERGAGRLVEKLAPKVYDGLRDVVLVRLGEATRLHLPLPPMPLSRVDVAPAPGDVPALDLLVHTQLPIRAPVGFATAATPEAINVEVSGSAAAELANWGIAHGVAPRHYTRELKPDPDGAYVPHFDWRPDRGDKPMVVHMFRTKGACAHFQVAAQPHVEVRGDQVRAYVANKELEQADASLAFAALANLKDAVSSTTSETKQAPAARTLRIGGREVTTRLVRAAIGGGDLRAAIAVELGPKAYSAGAASARSLSATSGASRGTLPRRMDFACGVPTSTSASSGASSIAKVPTVASALRSIISSDGAEPISIAPASASLDSDSVASDTLPSIAIAPAFSRLRR
ncbi:MAG: hypothetical protein KF773_15940 [Deltaproteobacteria bacterium]|nr:hypothetical protein [Deltaproteobacteria bacterium]